MNVNEASAGKIQIYSIEEQDSRMATCIVRCVGGEVRTGQLFGVGASGGVPADETQVALDWIERYGQRTDFLSPPHSAMIHLSGRGAALLTRNLTITSIENGSEVL
ncbi:hypothetical protein [Streptomyces avermitilis]|uniref:hypothetical protein n=1 Tax=Streptomyces avermitilis TaxID=33903 RepID=UPI0033BB4000